MGAGRPKEHRKKLVAYVKEGTDEGIRGMVGRGGRARTIGRAVDMLYSLHTKLNQQDPKCSK